METPRVTVYSGIFHLGCDESSDAGENIPPAGERRRRRSRRVVPTLARGWQMGKASDRR